jgi:Nudix N-terminal
MWLLRWLIYTLQQVFTMGAMPAVSRPSIRCLAAAGDDHWRHVCTSCGYIDFINPKMVRCPLC